MEVHGGIVRGNGDGFASATGAASNGCVCTPMDAVDIFVQLRTENLNNRACATDH